MINFRRGFGLFRHTIAIRSSPSLLFAPCYSTSRVKEHQRFIPAEINPIGSTNTIFRSEFQKSHFVRVDKLLGNMAVASRRSITEFMKKNNVSVVVGYIEETHPTGEPTLTEKLQRVKFSSLVYPPAIRVNGKQLDFVHSVSIAMHKPRGYVCSHTRDEPESKIVFDLLPKQLLALKPKLSVAGRLDKWASGLLILSQDGQLVNSIISRDEIAKKYCVDLKHPLKGNEPEQFSAGGIQLRSEKKACLPATMEIINPKQVSITLREGKYHQIRRMIASVGNLSLGVHREQIGDISLGDLPAGSWRNLTPAEVEHLWSKKPLSQCSNTFQLSSKPLTPSLSPKKRMRKYHKARKAMKESDSDVLSEEAMASTQNQKSPDSKIKPTKKTKPIKKPNPTKRPKPSDKKKGAGAVFSPPRGFAKNTKQSKSFELPTNRSKPKRPEPEFDF